MDDLISRNAAINALTDVNLKRNVDSVCDGDMNRTRRAAQRVIAALPSAQPETCDGCKHLGKWENEFEYGYPSPCTRCKRRTEDHYER